MEYFFLAESISLSAQRSLHIIRYVSRFVCRSFTASQLLSFLAIQPCNLSTSELLSFPAFEPHGAHSMFYFEAHGAHSMFYIFRGSWRTQHVLYSAFQFSSLMAHIACVSIYETFLWRCFRTSISIAALCAPHSTWHVILFAKPLLHKNHIDSCTMRAAQTQHVVLVAKLSSQVLISQAPNFSVI